MFEAYKVGITLGLTNQVSGVLGFIIRDLVKTDEKVIALKRSLKEIKLLGMTGALVGGVGLMGIGMIRGAVRPAMEYAHQIELMNAAGMQHVDVVNAINAAWATSGSVMTTSASDNLAAIRELRMVFQTTDKAIEHLSTVQRLQAILQNVRGGEKSDEAYTVAKALEMKGTVKDPKQFDSAADAMIRAIIASGGKINAGDFQSVFKYGRAATIGWDEQFTYKILPTLIQEMKTKGGSGGAGGPGNALMSAYAEVVGGSVPQKSLKVWQKLGLLDPSKVVWDKVGSAKGLEPGGIKGGDVFSHNPYEWTQKYLLPALKKAGYESEDQQRQVLQYLFPNRTAGFAMSQLAMQGWKFDRDQKLIEQAGGLNTYDKMIQNDPKMALAAMDTQWENLKTAIGYGVIPIILPAMRGLAEAFTSLGNFLREHPTLTRGLVGTFAALSVFATIGGALLITSAAFKGLGLLLGGAGIAKSITGVLLPAFAKIGEAFMGIGNILLFTPAGRAIMALAAVGFVITNHEKVAQSIDDAAPGIGDTLFKIKETFGHIADSLGRISIFDSGPKEKKSDTIVVNTHLDGRPIARSTAKILYSDMNGTTAQPGGFDGRQSFTGSDFSAPTD